MVALGSARWDPSPLGSADTRPPSVRRSLQAQALLRADGVSRHLDGRPRPVRCPTCSSIGYLAYRSAYVPKILGVLLAIAGAGYVFDTFGEVLAEGAPSISTVTFLGEFLLAVWLVIRSRHISLAATQERSRS